MKQCTEKQFHTQNLIKNEINNLMSETDIDWTYIIERITHLQNIKEWLPDISGEVKDTIEWHDPLKYREGFTKEEFLDWLRVKTQESFLNQLTPTNHHV